MSDAKRNVSCWLRVLLGIIVFITFMLAAVIVLAVRAHGFLSVQSPVQTDIIVVSGTVSDSALERIAAGPGASQEVRILTVGGPIGRGSHLSSYRDYAALAAATLQQLGIPASRLVAIPAPRSERDRVYATAQALQDWLTSSDARINSLNVYAVGVRGRRTWILFREALGPEVDIGIVSLPDEDYDSAKWWSTSEGFRTVTGELIAYLYVKTLFRPDEQESASSPDPN